MADLTKNDVTKSNEELLEDDNIITMVDVLEEEKKLEEDAFAVLGASDDKNCTYSQGYVKRQALYACKTCMPKREGAGGICLACSYHCHEGHDLVELYTKRNFRCDCGNSLFGTFKCNLQPEKDESNVNNKYNHNFVGVYCTCERPYPDPEDNTMDEMIQCIVCEDWYHTRHLGLDSTSLPTIEDYSEMICNSCSDKLTFLDNYIGLSVSKIKNGDDCSADGDGKEINVGDENVIETKPPTAVIENVINPTDESGAAGAAGTGSPNQPNESNNKTVVQECKLKPSVKGTAVGFSERRKGGGATFWRDGFRSSLCKCPSCMDVYAENDVSYLVDPMDTVQAYEEEGESRRNISRSGPGSGSRSGYEQGLEALSSLDRVKQVEAIHRYNEMQEHLKAYLAKFAENKKVVRPEDIKEFFTKMESRKRQKVELPYFCH